ncbi:Glycosyl hydrolase family 98 putative carbohydrate binding module [Rhodopirellula sp. SWK7]|nr:Glycosyl hydrolase family 98 putative carbohydrate binding module [Rhodopirellula sp. SWK7]
MQPSSGGDIPRHVTEESWSVLRSDLQSATSSRFGATINGAIMTRWYCFLFLFCVISQRAFSAETAVLPLAAFADGDGIQRSEARIAGSTESGAIDSPGQVVAVYFTPANLQPAINHVARIRRIVEETAGFYERELLRHGFRERAMAVLRNDRDEVDVIDVIGAGQGGDYGKSDGGRIRDEVVPVLRKRGIAPNKSVILLFCNLMDYDPVGGTISHHSPYYGGGSHLSGTAWQCDSEILDPLRFRDLTPIRDGEYGDITIGRHNSIFIGGVIHELGHALSLPHCRQRRDESVRGTALMGAGNRTYSQELRGEGRGTFLTQAHALRLAAHPVFNRRMTGDLKKRPATRWPKLRIVAGEKSQIRVHGMVQADVPVHGVVAYFDPRGGGDYDATTATAVPDDRGRFAMQSGNLRVGDGELRLTACHVNGATSVRSFFYRVERSGQPDLSAIRVELELAAMVGSIRRSKLEEAEADLATAASGDESLMKIGRQVLDRFRDVEKPTSVNVDDLDSGVSSIGLSKLIPISESVGWLSPTYDSVPEPAMLLSIGGQYYAEGIYAHAPSSHVYRIDRQWNRLSGNFGMQNGHYGKVDFQIVGDGQLIWSSRGVGAGQGGSFDLDVSDVKTLSLMVTDGGNGGGGDWGVWVEPLLSRTSQDDSDR